ncbi:MAG: DUF4136 domain-containing protein [Polaromonas sp.]|nr:DUF4136 domain-containing protein [Polaromonas sp.]
MLFTFPVARMAPSASSIGPRLSLTGAGLILVALATLAGCASTLSARVTNFNQWPTDAAGATFSVVAHAGAPNELEQATYYTYVQAELEKRGLQRVAPSQPARLQVALSTGKRLEEKSALVPVYIDSPPIFYPPYRDQLGRYYPGVWVSDPLPRYAGDRVVNTTIQITTLQVRILDSKGAPADKARTVFDSRAVFEGRGSSDNLPVLVPYLARAVFDDFPGQNGQVRQVQLDPKTGAVIKD